MKDITAVSQGSTAANPETHKLKPLRYKINIIYIIIYNKELWAVININTFKKKQTYKSLVLDLIWRQDVEDWIHNLDGNY